MKSQTSEPSLGFKVIGSRVLFYWNEVEKTVNDTTVYEYDFAEWKVMDSRNTVVEKIIASKYTIAEELATINNKEDEPTEYSAYMAFREFAKTSAAAWIAE